jgi:hypothetical protein
MAAKKVGVRNLVVLICEFQFVRDIVQVFFLFLRYNNPSAEDVLRWHFEKTDML